ncbi:hypothetical protein C8246_23785 [Paracidovorax avenae]|uniref:hypothetical protein n=1 Tax=Paracidovorax avenae TaxID=80867 RepID=UPI000D16EB31|nr:hypothetical protein [Paracidovorax avenae]AVS71275.1 hypothetical protein C8247_13100 [Paracidovorax avenae]AVS94249.1 hypothetical protein C8246_23785 [Paracidovorax avenae]AVT06614.1 hypothetical protein C8248_12105 [Paracidovorax avenae]AVT20989.1 hypothetical protein C7Y68_14140 [Paracidovorax avenae]
MNTLWFLLLLPLLWLNACRMLAARSGWRALADSFPEKTPPTGKAVRFASARMGRMHGMPIHYAHCLTVTAGPEGLSLSAPWFVFFHRPPIHLPWSQVKAVKTVVDTRNARVCLHAGEDGPSEFMLMGSAGQLAKAGFEGLWRANT